MTKVGKLTNVVIKRIIMIKKVINISISTFLVFLFSATNIAYSAPTPQKIPTGIIETSKKLNLWRDIYTTQQKVVVYSYKQGSTCPYQSQAFHNKISSSAANSGGKYRARPTGPDKMEKEINLVISKIEAEAKNVKSQEDVNYINSKIRDFNKLLTFTNKCTMKACIINPSKGEYILLNRNAEEVINAMKSY